MKVCSDCHQHYIESNCPHCEYAPTRYPSTRYPTKMLGLILGVGLTACAVAESKYGVPMVDNDVDGYSDYEDCNDNDPNTYPGAALEDSDTACMTDADGDGYGDANLDEDSPVEPGTDCDDSDPDINPGNGNCEPE